MQRLPKDVFAKGFLHKQYGYMKAKGFIDVDWLVILPFVHGNLNRVQSINRVDIMHKLSTEPV